MELSSAAACTFSWYSEEQLSLVTRTCTNILLRIFSSHTHYLLSVHGVQTKFYMIIRSNLERRETEKFLLISLEEIFMLEILFNDYNKSKF